MTSSWVHICAHGSARGLEKPLPIKLTIVDRVTDWRTVGLVETYRFIFKKISKFVIEKIFENQPQSEWYLSRIWARQYQIRSTWIKQNVEKSYISISYIHMISMMGVLVTSMHYSMWHKDSPFLNTKDIRSPVWPRLPSGNPNPLLIAQNIVARRNLSMFPTICEAQGEMPTESAKGIT